MQAERRRFGDKQDISLGELAREESYKTKKYSVNSGNRRRINLSDTDFIRESRWLYKNKIRREYRHLSGMQLTHMFQFVKFRDTAKYLELQLPFPGIDLDREEEELLNRWFEYVFRRVSG